MARKRLSTRRVPQRRKPQGQFVQYAPADDRWSKDDKEWFEAHPGESERWRNYVPGEFGDVDLDYNVTLVRVSKFRLGRTREMFQLPGDREVEGAPASEHILEMVESGALACIVAPRAFDDIAVYSKLGERL